MRRITKRQFDAYCYARQHQLAFLIKEVAWFEAGNKKLLATVILDEIDRDFGYVVLGRDRRKMFRCLSVSKESYLTPDEAIENLRVDVARYLSDGQEIYPQGDEKEAPNEILIPVVSDEKLHDYFRTLINEPRFEAARNLIREIVYSYKNPDNHYIREFQTDGFDARIWELYLYVYFHSEGLDIKSGQVAPDYHLSALGQSVFVEAVTVNASKNPMRPDPDSPNSQEEILQLTNDYLPIKYGSPLFSKLEKKYWQQSHVTGKPLVLAIHDYHMSGSMTWSRSGLSEYLYGIRTRLKVSPDGTEIPVIENIYEHSWKGKTIPSNFFEQPNAENVSAVLFSNAATITKFNRMGKLAGLGSKNVKMIRSGYMYNPDPDALRPISFTKNIDDPAYEESWSESLIMYHNPNALYPIDVSFFPSITHLCYDKASASFYGVQQDYDILSSCTLVVSSDC